MRRNKIALALSFIYCGLGQICMGKFAKGMSLAAIYTLLIFSFHSSKPLPVTHFFLGVITLAMWIMGIVDSYIAADFYKREFRTRLTLTIISGSIVISAIALMLISWPRIFSIPTEQSIQNEQTSVAKSNKKDKAHSDKQSEAPLNEEQKPQASGIEIPSSTGDTLNSDDEIPQLMASNQAYSGSIVIHSCSLEPDTVKPGAILIINYEISASESVVVGLAFSIQERDTAGWISDLGNDLVPHTIRKGRGRYSRKFIVPPGTKLGKYDVAWGVWDPGFDIAYDSKLSKNALTIIASNIREMFTDSAQYSANIR